MRRLRFCGKQGDGSCILESDLHTNLIGEARGVASSNYEPDASDTVDRHAHEPRDGHDYEGIEGQLWPMHRLGETCSSGLRGICFLA